MLLNIFVAIAATYTGGTCAAIDNRTNTAVWATPTATYRTTYSDRGDLIYRKPPTTRAARLALASVESALRSGTVQAGTVPVRCVW